MPSPLLAYASVMLSRYVGLEGADCMYCKARCFTLAARPFIPQAQVVRFLSMRPGCAMVCIALSCAEIYRTLQAEEW